MKKRILRLPGACLAGLVLWASALIADEPGLRFDNSWVRALPPGLKMTAAFGVLRNPGSETVELLAFGSPQFGDVSLHRTEVTNGVSRMRAVASLTIGPGDSVELAPGGYHLMLMKPAGALEPGQTVALEAISGDGRTFRFEVPVERR